MRHALLAIALASPALPAAVGPALAQSDLAAKGRAIAENWCQECHVIGTGDQAQALAGAPSFQSLAARGDLDEKGLAYAMLVRPHPVMPRFPVTRDEIRSLVAYLDSLAPKKESALPAPQRADAGAPVVLAAADAADPVAAGKALLEKNCSPCHAVEGAGPSPVSDAPPFSTLSERYPVEDLQEALAEGILVTHPTVKMPEFVFQPAEIDAILAYLTSIQHPTR